MTLQLAAFVVALAIAWGVTPAVRRTAIRLNVLVHPGGRRVHTRPMPLWGGIAIYGGFAVASLLFGFIQGFDKQLLGVLVSGAIILIVGMLDDLKEFSAKLQVVAILGAAVILASFGVRIQGLSNPFGQSSMVVFSTFWSWIITLAWVFGVTKTVDFMDGLDGLAAGIGGIASGVLAIMAYYSGQLPVAIMAAGLCGACIGFLRFNFNPAKIFMGTGGSQFIGFALAAISIIGLFKVAAAIAIALPVLVLGVPLADGLFVVARRFLNRQPVHVADRSHLHHRLIQRGFSHRQAVLMIYLVCIVLGGAAIILLCFGR